MDQIRRLTPVSVDPESGHFSYEDLDGVMFNVSGLVQASPSFLGRGRAVRRTQSVDACVARFSFLRERASALD